MNKHSSCRGGKESVKEEETLELGLAEWIGVFKVDLGKEGCPGGKSNIRNALSNKKAMGCSNLTHSMHYYNPEKAGDKTREGSSDQMVPFVILQSLGFVLHIKSHWHF